MQLVIVYGPNQKRLGEDFFHSLIPVLDPTLPTVLCGDFNTVPDPVLDRFGCNPHSPWAYLWPSSLSLLTSSCDLVDIWRLRHPDERDYTWRCPNGTQGSRLDMFWVSSSLTERFAKWTFSRSSAQTILMFFCGLVSLLLLVVVLECGNSTRHCWLMLIIPNWYVSSGSSGNRNGMGVWRDAGKKRVKYLSQTYSRELAHGRRHRFESLEHTLFHLQRRQRDGQDVTALLADAKRDLETEHSHLAHGARIRARERWAEEGESSTSYFLSSEKARAARKLFHGIRNVRGVIVRSIHDILRVWCFFYYTLFTAASLVTSDQDFFISSICRTLSSRDRDLCEGSVTEEECRVALHQMKNKSPGKDGLS